MNNYKIHFLFQALKDSVKAKFTSRNSLKNELVAYNKLFPKPTTPVPTTPAPTTTGFALIYWISLP